MSIGVEVVIRGFVLSLRRLGVKYTTLEIVKRLLKRPYVYNGIAVRDAATFRVIRDLIYAGRGVV